MSPLSASSTLSASPPPSNASDDATDARDVFTAFKSRRRTTFSQWSYSQAYDVVRKEVTPARIKNASDVMDKIKQQVNDGATVSSVSLLQACTEFLACAKHHEVVRFVSLAGVQALLPTRLSDEDVRRLRIFLAPPPRSHRTDERLVVSMVKDLEQRQWASLTYHLDKHFGDNLKQFKIPIDGQKITAERYILGALTVGASASEKDTNNSEFPSIAGKKRAKKSYAGFLRFLTSKTVS